MTSNWLDSREGGHRALEILVVIRYGIGCAPTGSGHSRPLNLDRLDVRMAPWATFELRELESGPYVGSDRATSGRRLVVSVQAFVKCKPRSRLDWSSGKTTNCSYLGSVRPGPDVKQCIRLVRTVLSGSVQKAR